MIIDDSVYAIFDKYKLDESQREELLDIIKPIYEHSEFLRRMTDEFPHHGDVTLGAHILEDTVKTYLLSKRYMNTSRKNNYKLDLAVKIAMLHDLYTYPWQNSEASKTNHFLTSHGFRHPIEAVINAINWYPHIFDNEDESAIIIDGIIHHMYPLPVSASKEIDENYLDLKNYDMIENISSIQKEQIIKSMSRHKLGKISLARSQYKEGRIMARADKYVSIRQISNFNSALALVTGINSSLIRK